MSLNDFNSEALSVPLDNNCPKVEDDGLICMVNEDPIKGLLSDAFPDIPTKGELKAVTKGLYQALTSRAQELGDGLAEKAVLIGRFLRDSTQVPDQINNRSNNRLLADIAVNSAITGEIDLWRFVCLPELSLESSAEGDYVQWNYNFNNPRYDTLNPSLPFDKNLIEGLSRLGVTSKLTFILDDWEAPYFRTIDSSKNGFSVFKSLKMVEQQEALKGLGPMRKSIRDWISKSSKELSGKIDIIFFSEIIDYNSFVDLLALFELEVDEKYTKILKQEMEFVRDMFPKISDLECRINAVRRIAQYAVEVAILYSKVKNSVYLASEYPVNLVWKKLTLLEDIPTLFYAQDKDIRNI